MAMILTPWEWRFPPIAEPPDLRAQVLKTMGEAGEALAAHDGGEPCERVAEELMDVIHAAETLLRLLEEKFGVDLDEAYATVVAKNGVRGYYDEEEA